MEAEAINKVRTKSKIKTPKMYSVNFHNDDYTTMEFVVYVLREVFNKSGEEASMLMMKVHNEGIASVGVYTFDLATTKKSQVDTFSYQHKQPLKVSIKEV